MGRVEGTDALVFHFTHRLLHEAAYLRLTSRQRGELHRDAGKWYIGRLATVSGGLQRDDVRLAAFHHVTAGRLLKVSELVTVGERLLLARSAWLARLDPRGGRLDRPALARS